MAKFVEVPKQEAEPEAVAFYLEPGFQETAAWSLLGVLAAVFLIKMVRSYLMTDG